MAWPTGQEFNEAIQSPQSVFTDPDLRGGRAETNQHGFPRPRAGAFATVYRIENGGRAWLFVVSIAIRMTYRNGTRRYAPSSSVTPFHTLRNLTTFHKVYA